MEKFSKNSAKTASRPTSKIKIELSCDKYVDGQDRIAGYVVISGECTGNINPADIEKFLRAGELRVSNLKKEV